MAAAKNMGNWGVDIVDFAHFLQKALGGVRETGFDRG